MRGWTLVIPVKRADRAKSRLLLDGVDREQIARAIALDTIAAAASCELVARVLVVTADDVTAVALPTLRGLGPECDGPPRVVIEAVIDPGGGLTAALQAGLAAVGAGCARAILLGDVPALRGSELSAALQQSASVERAFVADAEGTGSVLATARAGADLPVLFGAGSAAAHRAAGFRELDVPAQSGLRRDIDLAAHLLSLSSVPGIGPLGVRTAAVLESAGLREGRAA